MKIASLFLALIPMTFALSQPADCKLAGDGHALMSVVISENASDATKAIAQELAGYLGKISGATFEVKNGDGSQGIVLGTRAEFPHLCSDAGKTFDESREAILIRSTAPRVALIGSDDLGVPHAAFAFLDALGCRWFMPGEHWTIVPQHRELSVRLDKIAKPAFRMRGFFGSGGFGPANPVDPKLEVRSHWEAFKRHNLFGGEFVFGGHSGEAYNTANKAVIEAHPEYRAMINGVRQPFGIIVKPCVSNPDAVKLYVEDRMKVFRMAMKTNPRSPGAYAVSVDPADGGGHCECPECVKIGSVSDRVFHLANQVAKAVEQEFPGRYASLYAYNEHAAVPSIALEPNVYVTVIPYGFQRTGMPGDDLIAAWSRKIPRMSLYDYWSIPDWESDLPSFDFVRRPADRIRYWHEHGIEGFSGESTHSAGAVGLAWHLAGRLMWDPKTDEKKVIAEFYEWCFGKAAPPMKRMLERWSDGFLLTTHELGLSYRDLRAARELAASDESVLTRLDDYARYLHYIRLWHEYQEQKPGTPERAAKSRALVTYLWRVYPTMMVHSFRMAQLIAVRFEKDQALAADFNPSRRDAAGWAGIEIPKREELTALMNEGETKYQPQPFEHRSFSKELAVRFKPSGHAFSAPMNMGGQMEFEISVPEGMTSVPVKIQVSNKPKALGDRLTLIDPNGKTLRDEVLPADGQLREIDLPTRDPGKYLLRIFDQKTLFVIQLPANVPLVMRGFISPDLSKKLHFYVPRGLKTLAMHAPGAIPIKLFDADGKPVTYEGRTLITAAVPEGQDGRVWSFSGYKAWTPVKMMNAPQVFSFFPDTIMVPTDADDARH
jgi:hypothetical protein